MVTTVDETFAVATATFLACQVFFAAVMVLAKQCQSQQDWFSRYYTNLGITHVLVFALACLQDFVVRSHFQDAGIYKDDKRTRLLLYYKMCTVSFLVLLLFGMLRFFFCQPTSLECDDTVDLEASTHSVESTTSSTAESPTKNSQTTSISDESMEVRDGEEPV